MRTVEYRPTFASTGSHNPYEAERRAAQMEAAMRRERADFRARQEAKKRHDAALRSYAIFIAGVLCGLVIAWGLR